MLQRGSVFPNLPRAASEICVFERLRDLNQVKFSICSNPVSVLWVLVGWSVLLLPEWFAFSVRGHSNHFADVPDEYKERQWKTYQASTDCQKQLG